MDHRTIPLEVLREFVRSQAELSSIRHVAEDAGVGRSTVHKFIAAGTTPHPRVRRLLALWYQRRLNGVDELELVRPYVSALKILFGDVPDSFRGRAMLAVLDDVERAYIDAEEEAPPWIPALRTRLARTYDPASLIFR
jgi:DNA-binding IclR family transcriptional regulator